MLLKQEKGEPGEGVGKAPEGRGSVLLNRVARVNLTETPWQLRERKRENVAKLASNVTIVQGVTGKNSMWNVIYK